MTISERSDLFAALGRGDADAVLGTPESEWLDFKGEPYRLAEDDEKLELAKDVTALANSGGGVIVIGYETQREESTSRDKAKRVSRVRRDLIDFDQYRKVVEGWTYPPIRRLDLRWWLEDEDSGVLTIEVAAAPEGDLPVLVTRAREEGLRRQVLLGLFQRLGDRVSRLTAGEIHAQIQLGRAVQRGGLLPPFAPSGPTGPSDEERAERLAADTRDVGLEGHRRYFLQAWPLSQTEVQQLHLRDPAGLRHILPDPRGVRDQRGFRLRTRAQPTLLADGGLRVLDEQRMSLSLERNGLLTWVVTAGSEFLAWADERRQRHSMNPLALVESTLEFARLFILEVLPRCEPRLAEWSVAGGMADLRENGQPSALPPGRLKESFREDYVEASYNHIAFGPMSVSHESPGAVAFMMLREVYTRFGIDEFDIPYVENDEVSEQLIRETR